MISVKPDAEVQKNNNLQKTGGNSVENYSKFFWTATYIQRCKPTRKNTKKEQSNQIDHYQKIKNIIEQQTIENMFCNKYYENTQI